MRRLEKMSLLIYSMHIYENKNTNCCSENYSIEEKKKHTAPNEYFNRKSKWKMCKNFGGNYCNRKRVDEVIWMWQGSKWLFNIDWFAAFGELSCGFDISLILNNFCIKTNQPRNSGGEPKEMSVNWMERTHVVCVCVCACGFSWVEILYISWTVILSLVES